MVRAQRNGDVVWVSSLSTSTEFMDSWNESDTESQLLTPQELCQAQHEDQAIGDRLSGISSKANFQKGTTDKMNLMGLEF